MTQVLLDTSAYSAFMRGQGEATDALQRADEIYLNAVIVGELLAGFLRGKHTQKNRKELETFLSSPRVDVLNLDEATAERYALILDSLWRAGNPIPTNDIWIAASAMQHALRLLTSDVHFAKVNQQVIVDTLPTA